MEGIIKQLHEGNYSCVITNKNEVRTFTRRGVADLFELQKQDATFLEGAFIADKVVGKAAAVLMILGGVSVLYTDVISVSALTLLHNAGLEVEFIQVVPFIKNRDGSEWCPLEKACSTIDGIENIYLVIEQFIKGIQRTYCNG